MHCVRLAATDEEEEEEEEEESGSTLVDPMCLHGGERVHNQFLPIELIS